jgi:hypothetical protein
VLGRAVDGTGRTEVGVADGVRDTAAGPVASSVTGVPGADVRGVSMPGRSVSGADGRDADGDGSGVGDAEGAGGAVLEAGGAIGIVGVVGRSGAVWRRGTAMRTAATQHRPAPAAVRSTRRRVARRRIVSY